MKTMASTLTMTLSLVITSWLGTSRTCSIRLTLRPTVSMKGARMVIPGFRVRV
jgi:hypothetical protein